jgi:phosphohistidine phosphatase SixA
MPNHPQAALRRRPLFTPIGLAGLGVLLFALLAGLAWNRAAMTTVFVVRHAEKAVDGTQDPSLSSAGAAHAARYASLFAVPGSAQRLTAVYATEFRRTQQTAEAVARPLGLRVQLSPADNSKALVAHIKRYHRGASVLVVGHSNTVPEVIRALGGRQVAAFADTDYARLYVVSVGLFSRTTVTELALP